MTAEPEREPWEAEQVLQEMRVQAEQVAQRAAEEAAKQGIEQGEILATRLMFG